jgi:twitching motility protein PilU
VKEAFYQTTEQGMQTFDEALLGLYRDGKVSMEEALANADSRANLEAQIHFA